MDDQMIVEALLNRNRRVTQQYLYVKCYPLFKSVYDNYFTDCQSCIEFINEIYVHLLSPNKQTGLCKLQSFQFGSTLTTWLKTVAVYYCYQHFRRKKTVTIIEEKNNFSDRQGDRFEQYSASMYVDGTVMAVCDLDTILSLMPNRRYAMLIRLKYVDGMSNEETAAVMQMTIDNFYNVHKRAKRQFNEVLSKEGKYGTQI